MNRTFVSKATILVGALVCAFVLTIYRPTPQGLTQSESRAAPTSSSNKNKANYDLLGLKIFNHALVRIQEQYVDPTRVDAKGMLVAALDYVQRNIAEVLMDVRDNASAITVTVNDKTQSFDISDVDAIWKLSTKIKEIFRFIQANMNPGSDMAQIEYAAVNGMLSTLDPHSNLLDPETAREMDVKTTGKFGGIGIEIGMRKDKKSGELRLTVIRLIASDTPAAKAGLKANDRIVRINGESTTNFTLNEAMSRLRGDPQTKLTVSVDREGMAAATPFDLVRDVIHVSSVETHLLPNGVGYIRLKEFSQEVPNDMHKGMEEMRKNGARAWVLDLRGNPGGLLEQAAKVADAFVDSGTIVATVGYAGKQREEKRAQAAGTDHLPLAVLINGGSASASEIVAGALKNLDRAIIIGQTSFGKGSVQIMTDNEDGSKLKLTTAQYLTPGDISIQSVGITPDIELDRAFIPEKVTAKELLRLLRPPNHYREADLDAHIISKYARDPEKPGDVVRYIEEEKNPKKKPATTTPGDDDDDSATPAPAEDDDETPAADTFTTDFQIDFASNLVASAKAWHRRDLIQESRAYVQKWKIDEEGKVALALGKLGIDWSQGMKVAGARLTGTVTTDKTGNKVTAGETIAITGSVTNSGTAPAFQVHAVAKNDDWVFEGTELVFGKVDPGQTRTYTVYVKAPKDSDTRMDDVEWTFNEVNGTHVAMQPTKIVIDGLPKPQFSYAYQLIDDAANDNGDGLAQKGESMRLRVQVKNVGKGPGLATTATIRTASGDLVSVNKGRFELKKVQPGETKTIEFTFDLKREYRDYDGQMKPFTDKEAVVELTVYDSELREGVNEKLRFTLQPESAGPQVAHGAVKPKKDVEVHEGASEDSNVIGTVKKGAVVAETGQDGQWVRVELEPGRPGFISAASVNGASGAATPGSFTQTWQVTPPQIALNSPGLETTGDHWTITGTATDDSHVEDVYILVSNRDSKVDGKKVYYLSNRGKKSPNKLDFSASVPVYPGNNMVTVVARENNEVRAVQSVFVLKTTSIKTANAP